MARFTATVDFPTPPLPELTAIMLATPGTDCLPSVGPALGIIDSNLISTASTPAMLRTASRAASRSFHLAGDAGVLSTSRNRTVEPSTSRSRTKFRLTMSRLRPGSLTPRRTSSIASRLIAAITMSPHNPPFILGTGEFVCQLWPGLVMVLNPAVAKLMGIVSNQASGGAERGGTRYSKRTRVLGEGQRATFLLRASLV